MFIKYCLLLSSLLILGCEKYNAAEYAVINNDFEKFSKIVNSQEKEIINKRGESLLHQAALYRRTDMVKLLIDKGYSVNRKNIRGISPLEYGCGSIEVVKLLVENGALTKRDSNSWQPISTAIGRKKIEVVHFLLDNGADLLQEDRNGLYPIHYAVDHSTPEMVEFLLPNYSLSHLTEGNSFSTINLALRRGDPPITKLIVSKLGEELAKSGEKVIFYAINSFNIELIEYLVQNGEDLNVRNQAGETPLENAIRLRGNKSILAAAIKGEPYETKDIKYDKDKPFDRQTVDQTQMIFIFVPPRPTGYFTYSHCNVEFPGYAAAYYKKNNGTIEVFKSEFDKIERTLIGTYTVSKQEDFYKIKGTLEKELRVKFELVNSTGANAELIVKDSESNAILPVDFMLEGDFSFVVTAIDHLKSNVGTKNNHERQRF